MTTVVATKKGIFADTLCSYSVPFKVSKIASIAGSVFAGAGDLDDLFLFFEWRLAGGKANDKPSLEDGLDILEVCASGIFIWSKKCVRIRLEDDAYAIGSGAQYATGAMAAGATPEEAIEIASRFDKATALPIQFIGHKKTAR